MKGTELASAQSDTIRVELRESTEDIGPERFVFIDEMGIATED